MPSGSHAISGGQPPSAFASTCERAYRLALLPFNSPWSLIGLPAMSVPAGFVEGLPVGMVIVAPRFGEQQVRRAGHAFQQTTDWHLKRPPV